ncbi:MAG TPA: hypothetical protein VEH10_04520 [Thermoplasmata archaeon]|nr:hypothetical protein [Thermoplasmata archaeon]
MVGYLVFLFGPILAMIHDGWAFGPDPSEYLLTAHRGFGGGPGELPYVFPLLPAAYTPLNAAGPSFAAAYATADVITAVLLVCLAASFGAIGFVVGRGRVAALASAATVGTFPAFLGEVGWGGQAQFLSLAFGALAVAVLLAVEPGSESWRAKAVAGGLLTAAVLTEPYSAASLVIFAAVVVLFGTRGHFLQRRSLLSYLVALGPPLAAGGALDALVGSSAPQGLDRPVLAYAVGPGGWGFAVASAGFADSQTDLVYLIVVGALVVGAFLAPGIDRRGLTALVGSTVGFLAAVFLLTPAIYWPRAAEFLAIPLGVATAVLISNLRAPRPDATAPAPPSPRRRFRLTPRRVRWVRGGTAMAAVALITVQVVAGYSGGYVGGLQFDEFSMSSLGALSWLRSAEGSVVLVAPKELTFPVAYATERPIYPDVQPFWFDTETERQAAVFGSTVVAGSSWIDAGPLELVEDGPPGYPSNPSLFLYDSDYLVPFGAVVEEEGGAYAAQPPPAGPMSSPAVQPNLPASGAVLVGATQLPTYNVSTVSAFGPSGSFSVNLSFRPASGSPQPVGFGFAFSQVTVGGLERTGLGESLIAQFAQGGGIGLNLSLDIAATGGPSVDVATPALMSAPDGPTLLWNVTPSGGSPFNVSLEFTFSGIATGLASLISEASALAAHDVRWVVVDADTNSTQLPRFALDRVYTFERASGAFDVFRVG